MKYAEGYIGRVFTIRLEDGDLLPESLEKFALDHGIKRGFCLYLGGIDEESRVVVGPKDGKVLPPDPMETIISGVHEAVGAGTIFPDINGIPTLHSHASLGRQGKTVTGCIRPGIKVWKTVEIILVELCGDCGMRILEKETGFTLLNPEVKETSPGESSEP